VDANFHTLLTTGGVGGTSGALTNSESRNVHFAGTLELGTNSNSNILTPNSGSLSLSQSLIVSGAYVTGGGFIGTNFTGNGAGLTNITSAIAADTIVSNGVVAGLAAGSYGVFGSTNVLGAGTPAKVIGTNGLTTVHFETNSVVFGNKNRTNAAIHVKDGAVWLPNATSDYGAVDGNQYAGHLIWRGLNGTNNNAPLADNAVGDGFAKIAAYYYWGGTPDPQTQPGNPSLLITAPKLRLEEGYTYQLGDYAGEVSVGNEDHFGMVNINSVPIDNAGVNVDGLLGRSHALGFRTYNDTLATGGTTKHQSLPGIQARGLPVASAPYSEDYSGFKYYAGELDFYAVVPIPRNGDPETVWDDAPGLITATMGTNFWDFKYPIYANGIYLTNVNQTNITTDPFGVARVAHGFSWKTTNVSQPGVLRFDATSHGAGRGIVLLGATEGDVVINPMSAGGYIQLGLTESAGNFIFLQRASTPTSGTPLGFSHPLAFRSSAYNGGSTSYKYPGIVGFAQANDASEQGRISIYSRVPHWNAGNIDPSAPSTAGTEVASFGTNGVVAASGISFKGDGQGVTNQNYAIFQRIWFNGTTQDTYPANTWTNVTWTTNLFSGQNHDSGSCFTLSNSFLIVNAAGAGRWKVHSDVSFFDATTTPGNSMTRLYKFNNTPGTLMPGTAVYVPSTFDSTSSKVAGSITLAAGDIIALQCYVVSSSTWTIGNIRSGFSGPSDYQCGAWVEFERQ
jgi:hypothetical protein